MLTRLYGIAATTFMETVRQPIYGVILLVTGMLMILNVTLAAYTLKDDNRLLLDAGLSTLLLAGLFLAAFSASGVLNREIENKTVMVVLAKPVSRPLFLAGKALGLFAASVLWGDQIETWFKAHCPECKVALRVLGAAYD